MDNSSFKNGTTINFWFILNLNQYSVHSFIKLNDNFIV